MDHPMGLHLCGYLKFKKVKLINVRRRHDVPFHDSVPMVVLIKIVIAPTPSPEKTIARC